VARAHVAGQAVERRAKAYVRTGGDPGAEIPRTPRRSGACDAHSGLRLTNCDRQGVDIIAVPRPA
jgi:hypothetical protein